MENRKQSPYLYFFSSSSSSELELKLLLLCFFSFLLSLSPFFSFLSFFLFFFFSFCLRFWRSCKRNKKFFTISPLTLNKSQTQMLFDNKVSLNFAKRYNERKYMKKSFFIFTISLIFFIFTGLLSTSLFFSSSRFLQKTNKT